MISYVLHYVKVSLIFLLLVTSAYLIWSGILLSYVNYLILYLSLCDSSRACLH